MAKIKQANQPMTNKMKFRLNRVVALIMAVVLLYVSTRLVEAAVVKSDFYQEYAAKQQMSTQVINANRGSIYSTDMDDACPERYSLDSCSGAIYCKKRQGVCRDCRH